MAIFEKTIQNILKTDFCEINLVEGTDVPIQRLKLTDNINGESYSMNLFDLINESRLSDNQKKELFDYYKTKVVTDMKLNEVSLLSDGSYGVGFTTLNEK